MGVNIKNKIPFRLQSDFQMKGDQPQALEAILEGFSNGLSHQTLLGVTGSGKTFTMANLIAKTQRPAIILAHNKTLAAQLYGEFKQFFPDNAVEYFVSYYDYYQPEAYVPSSGVYIEKDLEINEHIEQMRHSTTKSVLEREDTIIVASVSSIYGLGSPESYQEMILFLQKGDTITEREMIRKLANMQYTRSTGTLERGQYRTRGETMDIFPSDSAEMAIRISMFSDEIESIGVLDPLLGKVLHETPRFTVYPKSHYATPKARVRAVISDIKSELKERIQYFEKNNKLVEAQRIKERTHHDLELLNELGFCKGIENYSRYLSGRNEGEAPPTLFDYLPQNALMFVDESHATIPQIGAMHKGDRSRKENLVNHGFRLPSALDNRPLRFDEWEALAPQMLLVSATPSHYEKERCSEYTEQLVRPTGLLDPQIEIRPISGQVDDLFSVIHEEKAKGNRVLATVLTKKFAEDLSGYLKDKGVKVAYLHADIDTVERMEIIRALRAGIYDILIGINLLREGLDMPEVSTVCILDADHEGFLRSERSLIQTIGRAARNLEGRAILYAERITDAMKKAMEETSRRREIQEQYNQKHGIIPQSTKRNNEDNLDSSQYLKNKGKKALDALGKKKEIDDILEKARTLSFEDRMRLIAKMRVKMRKHAEQYDYESATKVRDQIREIENMLD